ncbi:MAG: serine hydroxymethyltransferase, partial [Alteromonadales bacterium]|nr:serine hydroxymethyltransferase [Alteromonadales bacterium]
KEYQQAVLANAKAMVKVFQDREYKIVSDGAEDDLFLVDLIAQDITGKEADAALGLAHITVNMNSVPNDPRSPFVTSGLRIGTPAFTRRGATVSDATELAGWICDILDVIKDEEKLAATIEAVKVKASAFCKANPVYG